MILSDIRQYLQQCGQATLSDIALHVDAEPDAVKGMLDVWIRKGRVHKQMMGGACGTTCSQCDPAATELYLWIDGARPCIPLARDCNTR